MTPQCSAVLRLLREHPEGITPALAQEIVGTTRLAARIADLKAEGYEIETDMVTVPTRYAHARVARYRLKQPEQTSLGWTA